MTYRGLTRALVWSLALVAGCAAPLAERAEPSSRVLQTADGVHALIVSLDGGLPFNEPFELFVRLERVDGTPLADGLSLRPSGWMPEHGHGLVQHPRADALGAGRFRTHGWLLHMRGLWELRFDVLDAKALRRATLAVRLP